MRKDYLERYFVAGSQNFPELTLAEYEIRMKEIMQSGITAYQFREKGAGLTDGPSRLALARRLQAYAKAADVPFFVDDDIDLAIAIKADGVHVGQDDMPITEVIARVPDEMMVGLSVRNVPEMQAAQTIAGIDYLGVGPIYATTTKADAADPLGVTGLQAVLAANTQQLPTVGIGGITLAQLPTLYQAGLDGVAVISLLSAASDVPAVITQMKAQWG